MLDTPVNSFHFYFLVAVLQGFALAIIIMVRKPVKLPGFSFGILIFLFSLSLLHGVLEESIHAFNAKFPYPMDFNFAFGPLVYLHITTIVNPKLKLTGRDIFHFLPSLLIDVLLFMVFFNYAAKHMEWAENNVQNIQLVALVIGALVIFQFLIYLIMSIRVAKSANIRPAEFATIINKWFKTIIVVLFLVIGFLMVAIPIGLLNIELFDQNSYLIYKPLGILNAICIYWLGYQYLLKFSSIIKRYMDRTQNVKFSEEQRMEKEKQLTEVLESGEIYRDEELNLGKLARRLEWPERDVSWIIGESFNSNFNDLINRYRVNAFKKLADQPESKKFSIMGIAKDVGFNSKASFYRAFKKECGQTPSEYLASQKI